MIPCLNEEATLPLVFETMPKSIPGVDSIEVLIINDGSTDRTVEVAQELGVRHFVHHRRNQGLAYTFRDGLKGALEIGADIIVLTDGDNQYPQERIPDLIQPILDGKADVVIADRETQTIEHFSPLKKFYQRNGTKFLNLVAGTAVPDATSGFRAFSREAALKLNLVSRYSFGMETIIQSGHKRMAFAFITIKTNPKTRESRLIKSNMTHVRKSGATILRGLVTYKPYALFLTLGLFLLVVGLIPFVHYLYVILFTSLPATGSHHLQSLIIGGTILTASFFSLTLGVVADMISVNRALLEDVLTEVKRGRTSETARLTVQNLNHHENGATRERAGALRD
ncbi:glycosyltransferase family 2 protein [Rugosimonospora acidiphila]|uniref:Glycosyltransferase family 2 protein n=2 Tax=Rugosimonospora acidiphila TaxID=556531 RepID=A0ABP9SFL4_9ACTN